MNHLLSMFHGAMRLTGAIQFSIPRRIRRQAIDQSKTQEDTVAVCGEALDVTDCARPTPSLHDNPSLEDILILRQPWA